MIENKFKKEQVIGIWTLVSYEVVDNMGNKTYPMGEDATGFIFSSQKTSIFKTR